MSACPCVGLWTWKQAHGEARSVGVPWAGFYLAVRHLVWLLRTEVWFFASGVHSPNLESSLSPISSCMCVLVSVYVCAHRKGRPECMRLSSSTTLSIPGSRVSPWAWGLVSWIGWKPARPSNPLIFLVGGIISVYGLPGLLHMYYTSELGSFQICGKY